MLAAGCGTTVHGAATSSTTGADNFGAEAGAGAAGPGAAAAAPGGTTVGGSDAAATTPSELGSEGAGQATLSTGSSAHGNYTAGAQAPARMQVSAKGAKTLLLGVRYCTDCSAGDAALGAANLDPGNPLKDAEAVRDDINNHGGIAGLKVELDVHRTTATSNINPQAQAACAQWTQDHHVFAAFWGNNETLESCMTRAGTPLINTDLSGADQSTFARYPVYAESSSMNLDRVARVTVNGLDRQHFFTPGAVVGIASYDDPNYVKAVQHSLLPALKSHGITWKTPEFVHTPESEGDLSNTSQSAASAVLRMRTEGVTHVLLMDGAAGIQSGGILTLEFMTQAQSQGWTPSYGLNSGNGLTALAGDVPPTQLHNSLAVGWEPAYDESAADDPDSHANAARKRCVAIMAKAGLPANNRNALAVQLDTCDQFWFLQKVIEVGGDAALTQAGFLRSIALLGSSYQSPLTFSTMFAAGRRDGVREVRNAKFVDGCTCFRYTSPPYVAG